MRIDIDGPSAIGKTTLIRSLCQELPGAQETSELLMQKKNPYLSWKTREEYLQKQMWFFDQTLQRYTQFPDMPGNIRIHDIGITDVMVHTAVFPGVNALDFDVWEEFQRLVKEQYEDLPLADLVIYLHASEEVIRRRQQEDRDRVRGAFESNLRMYASQKAVYEKLAEAFPDQICLVAADGGPEQVKREALKIVKRRQEQKEGRRLTLYQVLEAVGN